jgi:RNA polymerase sigma-70 factor, ECF subfamily
MMESHVLGSAPAERRSSTVDFRNVFERELDYVWNSLRRLGVPPRDIEDLAHDVFLQVFRQLDRYEPARPIRPWLFGFAARIASDYRRRARNRLEILGLSTEPPDPRPNALDRLANAEAAALAEAVLERIDLGPRSVFILHELDDCPVPEIARALGIPIPTAYSRLRIARKQFSVAVDRLRRRGGAT